MSDIDSRALVPEPSCPRPVIVFLLKHAAAFEWACVNCKCDAEPEGGRCATPGGKWQQAQGETGLDVVGRLATPRHRWFSALDPTYTTVVLEAKGDRVVANGTKVNRPAYNEMTAGLAAFFLSNLARLHKSTEHAYGWLVPKTFHEQTIADFEEAQANLGLALPPGRVFLLGAFDGRRFWRAAPRDLHEVARTWFRAQEGGADGRNALLRARLNRAHPGLRDLVEDLFEFRVVRAAN